MFKVEYGSIYNKDCSLMIDSLAIVMCKYNNLILYGDKYMHSVEAKYLDKVNKYANCGLTDLAEGLKYIEFDRYDTEFTIDEICILLNHLVHYNMTYDSLMELMSCSTTDIKGKLLKYKEIHDFYIERERCRR